METIEETIQAILDEQHECRWLDTSELEVYLRKVADKQKAIDDDAAHAIVEEQVLKAIEKQKQIDIARFKQMIHQVVIKELGMSGELARHISSHIVSALK